MDKYFTSFYPDSVADFTSQEKKILNIRQDLNGLLYQNNFDAVEAMIKGVLFTDADLCV